FSSFLSRVPSLEAFEDRPPEPGPTVVMGRRQKAFTNPDLRRGSPTSSVVPVFCQALVRLINGPTPRRHAARHGHGLAGARPRRLCKDHASGFFGILPSSRLTTCMAFIGCLHAWCG